MKGTGRILAPEASALCLAPIRAHRRARPITVTNHITANHCEGGKAKEETLHAAAMACRAFTLHAHALCHSIVHACQCVHFFLCVRVVGGLVNVRCNSFPLTCIVMTYITSDSEHCRVLCVLARVVSACLICMNKITWLHMRKSTLIYSFSK